MTARPPTAVAMAVDLVEQFNRFSAYWRAQVDPGGPVGANRVNAAVADVWAAAAVAVRAYDFGPLFPIVAGPCPTCGDPIGELDVERDPALDDHERHMTDGHWHDDCSACRRRRVAGGDGLPPARITVRPCGHTWSGILPGRTTGAGNPPAPPPSTVEKP